MCHECEPRSSKEKETSQPLLVCISSSLKYNTKRLIDSECNHSFLLFCLSVICFYCKVARELTTYFKNYPSQIPFPLDVSVVSCNESPLSFLVLFCYLHDSLHYQKSLLSLCLKLLISNSILLASI
jgi:hypothetical protein